MKSLVKQIDGVDYYNEEYKELNEEVKEKMLKTKLEPEVEKVKAVEDGRIVAFTAKSMDYVREV